MAGYINITFKIAGQTEINRKLTAYGQDITDLSPAWEQVGNLLLSDFAVNFAQEGGYFGKGAWAQWAPLKGGDTVPPTSTVRDRIRKGYGGAHPILERTSQLRQSLTQRGTPGNIFDVRPMGLTVGTATPYARFHQFGTSKMPARLIVGVPSVRLGYGRGNTQSGSILNILQQYVMARARAAGLRVREEL